MWPCSAGSAPESRATLTRAGSSRDGTTEARAPPPPPQLALPGLTPRHQVLPHPADLGACSVSPGIPASGRAGHLATSPSNGPAGSQPVTPGVLGTRKGTLPSGLTHMGPVCTTGTTGNLPPSGRSPGVLELPPTASAIALLPLRDIPPAAATPGSGITARGGSACPPRPSGTGRKEIGGTTGVGAGTVMNATSLLMSPVAALAGRPRSPRAFKPLHGSAGRLVQVPHRGASSLSGSMRASGSPEAPLTPLGGLALRLGAGSDGYLTVSVDAARLRCAAGSEGYLTVSVDSARLRLPRLSSAS